MPAVVCAWLLALLSVTPASALRAAPSRRAVLAPSYGAFADAHQEQQKRALVVSGLGPDSRYGCGVREFVFILDLQECGYHVDIVTEDGGSGSLAVKNGRQMHEHFGWSTQTPVEAFRSVRWFNKTEAVDLGSYTSIFFFGWYWEFQKKGSKGKGAIDKDKGANDKARPLSTGFVEGLESAMLPKLLPFRSRTTLMLDDVPDVRCEEEAPGGKRGEAFCRSLIPQAVANWTAVASRVFTLTDADAAMVSDMFRRDGIEDAGPVRVWPLHLQRLQRLQEEERTAITKEVALFDFGSDQRVYLTMVANDHAANREFTQRIFSSGAAERWCNASLTLIFVGTIGGYVDTLKRFQYANLPDGCALTAGVQSRTVLAQKILPRTLAILNPFWRDLRSGISVKSYEALAAGVPLVTSIHGLRGLESCGAPQLALGLKEADDVSQYVDFVDRLLLNGPNYGMLTAEALQLRSACVAQQEAAVAPRACGSLQ